MGHNRAKKYIFGIGLSRTGTKSLSAALNILGFNSIHYPVDELTLKNLTHGDGDFDILKSGFDCITDITTIPFYKDLFFKYPDSLFILTSREKSEWLKSLEKHWLKRDPFLDPSENETHMTIRRFLRSSVYGTYYFNKERMTSVYDRHIQDVNDFFKSSPERILRMDITSGDGWKKLCPFLNIDVPITDFPSVKTDMELENLLKM